MAALKITFLIFLTSYFILYLGMVISKMIDRDD